MTWRVHAPILPPAPAGLILRTLPQLLNRRAPFGHNIIESLREIPQYDLTVTEVGVNGGGHQPVQVELSVGCSTRRTSAANKQSNNAKFRGFGGSTCVLTTTSDLEFIDFRRIP